MSQSQNTYQRLCECGCGREVRSMSRFVNGHHRRTPVESKYRMEDRGFESECWTWTAAIGGGGYGVIRVDGVMLKAHRYMYERQHGPIADGLQLDHLCRQRDCVNPAHLEPVTHTENVRRSRATKLTVEKVRAIRRSGASAEALAERHGIRVTTVLNLKAGVGWPDAW